MAETESLRQVAQTRAPLSAWFGVLLLFALFGVIVLAVIGPSPRGNTYEETRAKNRVDKLKTNHDEDTKSLSTYAWIDKNKGTARIPIERAMELTVAQLAQQKPASAYPIATPPPANAPAPAAASPAPSASPQASASPKATTVSGVDSQNRGQPAGASNPPGAKPGTQPGAAASPAASPAAPSAKATVSPTPIAAPTIAPSASPVPVRGKDSPTPTATPH